MVRANNLEMILRLLSGAGGGDIAQVLRGMRSTVSALRDLQKILQANQSRSAAQTKALEQIRVLTNRQTGIPGLDQVLARAGQMGQTQTIIGGGRGGRGAGGSGVLPPGGAGGAAAGAPEPEGILGAVRMLRVQSSNVYAIGYSIDNGTMRVQFLGGYGKDHRSGPGAMYDYYNVPKRHWDAFQAASSKGKWVWDNLRVRGTIAGHRYDYRLVSGEDIGVQVHRGKIITKQYIPRLAKTSIRTSGPKKGMTRSVFQPRRVVVGGKFQHSQLRRQNFVEGPVIARGKMPSKIFGRGA